MAKKAAAKVKGASLPPTAEPDAKPPESKKKPPIPPDPKTNPKAVKPAAVSDGWKRLLILSKKTQEPLACASNAQLIFTHDPAWRGVLAYDAFLGDVVTRKLPPWPRDMQPANFAVGDFTEIDTWRAKCWIARTYAFEPTITDVGGALQITSSANHFHPVREFLESLVWDKKKRIDTWLTDIAGAVDNPYTRAVGKNFLLGAVARIYRPGEQVDSMPIFEGDQGVGKTTMVKILGGEWFLSTNIEIGNKDGYQALKRKWIVEMGELDSLTRAEVSHVKQYVSQSVDTYRASYARRTMDYPRQCVFVGTVNPEEGTGYLKDNTGARRFWPVAVAVLHPIKLVELRELRNQLFAEAVVRFKSGEEWHFTDDEVRRLAAIEAEARRQQDPWEHTIGQWLANNKKTAKQREDGISTHEVLKLALEFEAVKVTRADEMRCASALRANGWTVVTREYRGGVTTRIYRPRLRLKLVPSGGHQPDTSEVPSEAPSEDPETAAAPEDPSKKGKKVSEVSEDTPKKQAD